MADHSRAMLMLADESATCRLGGRLASCLSTGMKLYFRGDLGAGKTTLIRAILAALGHSGRVKSPTFTLVELYMLSRLNLYHFDFYRFRDTHEWREAGFSEYFGGDGVCLVEWPEKAGDDLPEPDLDISLEVAGTAPAPPSTARRATLVAHTPAAARCVASLADWNSPARPC
jgi:tRNA threonylcarbamoyladenosine biosynthesis protein TsaE